MDILATWMGQEIAKDLLAQKILSPTDNIDRVLEKILEQVRIAEDLSIDFEGMQQLPASWTILDISDVGLE